jgi:hypothetical protein
MVFFQDSKASFGNEVLSFVFFEGHRWRRWLAYVQGS